MGPLPAGELAALEANTPARGLQVTVLEPQLTVVAGHGDLKVSSVTSDTLVAGARCGSCSRCIVAVTSTLKVECTWFGPECEHYSVPPVNSGVLSLSRSPCRGSTSDGPGRSSEPVLPIGEGGLPRKETQCLYSPCPLGKSQTVLVSCMIVWVAPHVPSSEASFDYRRRRVFVKV